METEEIKKQQDLTWLENLQKNSWEPEVIISGITLAVLFIIPSRLFDISVILIQDYGLEQIPATLILVYFSLIISVFKLFLVIHLVMRFIWAGMLGITYAFPEGVIKEKLFKYSQSTEYPHPNTYLIKLERWCSILYGFPISVAIPIFTITVYLLILIGIYLVFNLEFQIVYVIFMLTIIALGLSPLLGKTSKLKDSIGKSMSGTVGAVYQSNLGKWAFASFSMVLIFISIPFISQDLDGFSSFQIQANLDEEDFEYPKDQGYFEEYNSDKKRFARIWTPIKQTNREVMELFLPIYKREKDATSKINSLLPKDSIPWQNVDSYENQFRILLNDSLISISKWTPVLAGHTNQPALMTQLPIGHLTQGVHEIRVEKITYLEPFLGAGDDIRYRKKWARFNFIKD